MRQSTWESLIPGDINVRHINTKYSITGNVHLSKSNDYFLKQYENNESWRKPRFNQFYKFLFTKVSPRKRICTWELKPDPLVTSHLTFLLGVTLALRCYHLTGFYSQTHRLSVTRWLGKWTHRAPKGFCEEQLGGKMLPRITSACTDKPTCLSCHIQSGRHLLQQNHLSASSCLFPQFKATARFVCTATI